MNTDCIDKLTLAAFNTGDLSSEKMDIVEKHLQNCSKCKKYLISLDKEKEDFLNSFPFDSQVHAKPAKQLPFPNLKRYYALAATIVILITGSIMFFKFEHTNEFRIKGKHYFRFVVKNLNGNITVRESHEYYPNERIQIVYSASKNDKLTLISIDENGKIFTYFPQSKDSSIVIKKGVDIPLHKSILLDSYIGKELFLAFFSENRLHVPTIKEIINTQFNKVESLKTLKIEPSKKYDVQSILITKRKEKK